MPQSTVKRYYVITQKIENIKHYYSHWERLNPESKVYGVIWNEYLAYGFLFLSKQMAKKMLVRLLGYDKKLKCDIIPISENQLQDALLLLKSKGLPNPIEHFNEWHLVPDKYTILPIIKNSL